MGGHRVEESVTPQEGRVLADPTASGRLPDGEPVYESLSVILPAFSLAQSGHGRLGENRAGALALLATIAAQSTTPPPGD